MNIRDRTKMPKVKKEYKEDDLFCYELVSKDK